ncbi:flagellar basal body-associated FliL family protein [Sandarakinorhabdus sp.]|uniref:flagellar basal body-associated FliL family protein n=1 Tax=Sandarakinorhabdus sp. TaxID=1916663 RepID=UPI00333E23E4
MADAKPEKPAKPKRNIMGILVPMIAFVAGAGAGGAGAAIALLQFGGGGGGGGEHAAAGHAEAPAPHAGPLEYVEVDNSFTSNLADSGRYLQIKLSISTFGGEEAVTMFGKHKPAVVSAVLAALGEARDADIASTAAKDVLRSRLKDVINTVLKNKGEPGIVEEVFFTSLVVQ